MWSDRLTNMEGYGLKWGEGAVMFDWYGLRPTDGGVTYLPQRLRMTLIW
jgi:hypothetical protein